MQFGNPSDFKNLTHLTAEKTGSADTLQKLIGAAKIPNLWKPSKDAYIKVEKIPLLGTGKADLKGIKSLAMSTLGLTQDE